MLSRSLLRLSVTPQTRSFTASALCHSDKGLLGRFNPWAKKSVDNNTPVEKTTTTTTTESIGNVTFDVDYHDDQEFSSWKSTSVIENLQDIQSSIQSIVTEHIQGVNDSNWQEASLRDSDIKFKVVKASIKQIGKEVPNLDLTNINSVKDLLAFYQRVPDVTQSSVEKFFVENANDLPSNLTFAPYKSS